MSKPVCAFFVFGYDSWIMPVQLKYVFWQPYDYVTEIGSLSAARKLIVFAVVSGLKI